KRQVRPAGVSGDVEQDNDALAAPLRGDERRAIGERCPGPLAPCRVGLGPPLAAHRDGIPPPHARGKAFAPERGKLLRLIPAQRAAEHAAATAQPHWYEVVIAGGQPWTCEAHQHPAVLGPARQLLLRFRGIADVGEDDHRYALLKKLAHSLRRRT